MTLDAVTRCLKVKIVDWLEVVIARGSTVNMSLQQGILTTTEDVVVSMQSVMRLCKKDQ
jgi:hypothetical protein